MFRKLVSSLPFSPALVGQLGFYARRLSREQAARRLGLIFTMLALVVQLLALISPPEPSYAASPSSDCTFSSSITKNDPDCRTCPHNAIIWINDSGCNKNLQLSIEATNLTRGGKSVIGASVSPDDRIQYTIRTTNLSETAKTRAAIEVSLEDAAEYATLTDNGGGAYDQTVQKITWGNVLLDPKQTDTRSFMMGVNQTLPITPQAIDSPSSYDCLLTVTYGNTLNNAVNCPIGKDVESAIKKLPETGPGENIIFSAIILIAVTYFYIRSRQLNREMKVIRRDYNVG